ncbi:ATP-binding cassette domain-containing protein [Psychrobacter sp. TAE2020]|uniref:ATP-binding cassette domain-containing protein n=1 Tax=Psychrobacter sp. TAE2020 TaxID=2846762 RepID=UPI001C128587|nr:ATP-binding cassette domain-containing protein [Psychrobacter sp. TAE2020]MBU5616945.1 ATP-binding cassette domain-containing protein [Psychrobacter sp. TAE2020]
MSGLVINNLTVKYPNTTLALDNLNLLLPAQSFCVVLGASGCGKSTLLNTIAGFVAATSGNINFDGNTITKSGIDRAVVFQDHALFPWLNVAENVSFAGKLAGIERKTCEKNTQKILQWVGLDNVANHSVWELSGGMQQRVGIARVLASKAKMLLLDEPFAALDAFMRESMQELLLTIWQQSQRQILLISHDIEEALFLATDLVVMGNGKILHHYRPKFNENWQKGHNTRDIKSDSEFIAWRERLFNQIVECRL